MTAHELLEQARQVAERAHAPYSRYNVGCALETEAGGLFLGCNVENASYGLTICAERNAVFQAVAAEGPGMKITRAAVICLGHEFPPCGACRQVLAEFSLPGGVTEIHFLRGGILTCRTVADLLPEAFGL